MSKNDQELLNGMASDKAKFGQMVNELAFGMEEKVHLYTTEKDTLEIDSRTSDALALAVRFGCPIYTYENILDSAGILMEETTGKKKKSKELKEVPKSERPELKHR